MVHQSIVRGSCVQSVLDMQTKQNTESERLKPEAEIYAPATLTLKHSTSHRPRADQLTISTINRELETILST
jgi:hypothetical protein